MSIDDYMHICLRFRDHFPDAERPSWRELQRFDFEEVARAIEAAIASPLVKFQRDKAAYVMHKIRSARIVAKRKAIRGKVRS